VSRDDGDQAPTTTSVARGWRRAYSPSRGWRAATRLQRHRHREGGGYPPAESLPRVRARARERKVVGVRTTRASTSLVTGTTTSIRYGSPPIVVRRPRGAAFREPGDTLWSVAVSTDEARTLALSLPEAVEMDHHGRPSFRIGGKIFATLWNDQRMNVMLDEGGIRTAVESAPDACEEVWWGKRLTAVGVSLPLTDPDSLSELLADAWEYKAPKRLLDDS